ncbi:MAG: hypothetical protein ACTSW2_00665 [Alphaproteobacteria bacterium]
MFNALLKAIFLPNATRKRLAARGRPESRPDPYLGPRRPAAARTGGRGKVLQDALSVYRQQRDVYESLDEETRRQIEADAAELFGDLGKRQR